MFSFYTYGTAGNDLSFGKVYSNRCVVLGLAAPRKRGLSEIQRGHRGRKEHLTEPQFDSVARKIGAKTSKVLEKCTLRAC